MDFFGHESHLALIFCGYPFSRVGIPVTQGGSSFIFHNLNREYLS